MTDELKFGTGNPILVPLTSSLYVPGKITDPENVVIDIGTGYYVKKVGETRVEKKKNGELFFVDCQQLIIHQ